MAKVSQAEALMAFGGWVSMAELRHKLLEQGKRLTAPLDMSDVDMIGTIRNTRLQLVKSGFKVPPHWLTCEVVGEHVDRAELRRIYRETGAAKLLMDAEATKGKPKKKPGGQSKAADHAALRVRYLAGEWGKPKSRGVYAAMAKALDMHPSQANRIANEK